MTYQIGDYGKKSSRNMLVQRLRRVRGPKLGSRFALRIEPETLTKSVAAAVQAVDPNLPLAFVRTMDELLAESRAQDRFRALLFGVFAAIALVLAALGIYGVMSFAVAQRTHEIGLRMALGAGQDRVVAQVMREGMSLALVGTPRSDRWAVRYLWAESCAGCGIKLGRH